MRPRKHALQGDLHILVVRLPACSVALTIGRPFSSPIALTQKFGTAPYGPTIFFPDELINDGRRLSEPAGPLQSSLVIGKQLALQSNNAETILKLLPYGTVGVNQRDGSELGALLPSPRDLQARQLRCFWDARQSFLPIFDGPPADAELCSRFFLRVPEHLSPR